MSDAAKDRLCSSYQVERAKVSTIAHGATIPHVQAICHCLGSDAQIRAVFDGRQKCVSSAPTQALTLVDMDRANPVGIAPVEVITVRNARLLRGLADAVVDWPVHARLIDTPLALGGVCRALTTKKFLMPLEVGQHIVPPPAWQTTVTPTIVIGVVATYGHHAVDGGGTSQHLATREFEATPPESGLSFSFPAPVKARIANGVAVSHRNAKPERSIGLTGLKQQHAMPWVAREAVSEQAAGSAGADDHKVVRLW